MSSRLGGDCMADLRCCQWMGCTQDALYPAPRSRTQLREYWWFCLDHVRAYNAKWNYYAGMTDAEVEADLRRDTVWQRPSWRLGGFDRGPGAGRGPRINDGFGFFGGGEAETPRRLDAFEQALMVMELRPPVTVDIVKARYKLLVKRFHPDANGGDKAAEERFKEVGEAYRIVLKCLQI